MQYKNNCRLSPSCSEQNYHISAGNYHEKSKTPFHTFNYFAVYFFSIQILLSAMSDSRKINGADLP